MGVGECRPLGFVIAAFSPLHQTMSIQDGMDGTGRGRPDHRICPDQFLPDLGRTPTLVLAFDLQDRGLELKRQLIGLPVGTSGAVLHALEAKILVAAVDLIPGLAEDPEFPSQHGHVLTLEQAGHKTEAFVHTITLSPGHREDLPKCPNV